MLLIQVTVYKYQIFQMNFSTISSGDLEFNKIMMQKHLDRKRQRKQNYQTPTQNSHRVSTLESLPQVNQNYLDLSNSGHFPTHKKQINQENQKMKKLLKDQLQQSLTQQLHKKKLTYEEERKVSKIMSTENGTLDYLEKQIERRDNFIRMCLEKQEKMKSTFVDQDLRKHRNALHLIEQNYDADVFNHESDRYQQAQKLKFMKVLETNAFQVENLRASRQIQKFEYGKYLDEKYTRERHNPITNPMEYHIQNPYIRKQLQKY